MMENNSLPSSLSQYQFSPEWGRAAYFYTHYGCIHQSYSKQHKEWRASLGILSNQRNHAMRGYFLIKSSEEFIPFLERFSDEGVFELLRSYITKTREETVGRLATADFGALSLQELAEYISWYYKRYDLQMIPALNLRFLDRALIPKLRSLFSHESDVDNCIAQASVSDNLSFGLEEEIAMLTLASEVFAGKYSRTSQVCIDSLQKIYSTFCWAVLGYYDEQPKMLGDYEKKLDELLAQSPLSHLAEVTAKIQKERGERKRLEEKYSSESVNYIMMASQASYMKDYFKSSINKVQYYAEPLFEEIAKRSGRTTGFVKDLTWEETPRLVLGESVDELMVAERIRHNLVYTLGDSIVTLIGADADAFEAKYLVADVSGTQFKGRVACRGRAIGKAVVVSGPTDFRKLQFGDILVVANTSPDFVPIMRKAAAIIAEEGGLTAHVSVVSREFGIPCIVGVSHITKILKDGDEVEVDAEKGVVKILKK